MRGVILGDVESETCICGWEIASAATRPRNDTVRTVIGASRSEKPREPGQGFGRRFFGNVVAARQRFALNMRRIGLPFRERIEALT